MRLFAPANNWDMTKGDSWWPLVGTVQTNSGIRVGQETALTFSAVFAATRVITETIASLPLCIMEQVDYRTTKKATGHPLWSVLHDTPTPEQDIVSWLDMQTAFQVNWGNAYAEIQRDQAGAIVALWPIHASRIPVGNIKRNGTQPSSWRQIQAGQPGEIVYWVNNDDGTQTPIPASDMLHVPGVLSSNGVTGTSIVLKGANTIGIAMATDEHAGAFFRNGAVANMALKAPAGKTMGKETAERLREQWQKAFGGVKNHYKTLLLEDGVEPVMFSIAPEAAQLIEARQFSVNEIARLYKVPPHMIGDLSRATYSNIESEQLSFVVHTMLPWIVRWEKALYRQLLTAEEKKRFRFKFNVMGLLRGDSAARAQFYTAGFGMGAFSPNDIREREDMNPIPGGDQYFVPGNNLVPLDKIGDMAQAQIDNLTAPPAPAPSEPSEDQENLILTWMMQQQREVSQEIGHLGGKVDGFRSDVLERIRDARESETELVAGVERAIARLTTDAVDTRNTAEIEEIAAKKAILDAQKAEIDAKLACERQTTRRVFALALKREIDKLAEWEWKWLSKAIDAPLEWVEARGKYYDRFRRYFIANLDEYAPQAAACGIILDLEWGANRYSADSITDLKSLDSAAADNYHDRLKECVNHFRNRQWTDRSQALADAMVERGLTLFEEQSNGKAATD